MNVIMDADEGQNAFRIERLEEDKSIWEPMTKKKLSTFTSKNNCIFWPTSLWTCSMEEVFTGTLDIHISSLIALYLAASSSNLLASWPETCKTLVKIYLKE